MALPAEEKWGAPMGLSEVTNKPEELKRITRVSSGKSGRDFPELTCARPDPHRPQLPPDPVGTRKGGRLI